MSLTINCVAIHLCRENKKSHEFVDLITVRTLQYIRLESGGMNLLECKSCSVERVVYKYDSKAVRLTSVP